MPTYSYACTQCDNRFDIVQSFTDESLSVCSECSGRLRKLFNSVGIVFKGSGFYRTDSRTGSVQSESTDESSKSDNGKSDNGKSDSGSNGSSESSSGSSTSPGSDSSSSSKDSSSSGSSSSGSAPAAAAG